MKRLRTKHPKVFLTVVFIATITVITVLVGLIMMIPNPLLRNWPIDSWLGYWGGLVGSALGVFGAFFVMQIQLKREADEKDRDDIPKIVVGTVSKEKITFKHGYDLCKNPELLNSNISSFVKIPIINGGNKPIFKIQYTFEIPNFKELIDRFAPYSRNKTDSKTKISYEKTNISGSNVEQFRLEYAHNHNNTNTLFHSKSSTLYETILLPERSFEIRLPPEFISLIMFYIDTMVSIYINGEPEVIPQVDLCLKYEDHNGKAHKEVIRIFLYSFQIFEPNTNWHNINYVLNTEIVKSNEKLFLREKMVPILR